MTPNNVIATAGRPLARSEIKEAFPGHKITIRRVDFTDLARASAYSLAVEGVNRPGTCGYWKTELQKKLPSGETRGEALERLKRLVSGRYFKGYKILI